jgi:signal recognition particle subunit SRP54
MIPGLSSIQKNVQVDEKAFVKVEAIINSMTKEERRNPKILNASRKRRIAKGSGTSIQEVNRLVKQFEEMQKMIKKLNNMDFNKAFRNFNLKLN